MMSWSSYSPTRQGTRRGKCHGEIKYRKSRQMWLLGFGTYMNDELELLLAYEKRDKER
jgi:hypothetical protein